MVVTDTLNIPCSNLCISGDSLFYYSTEWNVNTQSNTISYGIIDVRTKEVISTNFITDGSEKDIRIPYGIMVHPLYKRYLRHRRQELRIQRNPLLLR